MVKAVLGSNYGFWPETFRVISREICEVRSRYYLDGRLSQKEAARNIHGEFERMRLGFLAALSATAKPPRNT
jgi:hypothetical protein